MAQDRGNSENTTHGSRDRQAELEAGFLDLLGSFGPDATADDLAEALMPTVEAAKDPHE